MYLKKEALKEYPNFRKNIYYGPDGLLYKISRECVTKERRDFLKYVYNMPKIPGLLHPVDLLKDNEVYGYTMNYIPNSSNLDQLLESSLGNIEKLQTIHEIFQILDRIHKYFIFGDVRNANILFADNNICFLDFDTGILPNGESHRAYYIPVVAGRQLKNHTKLTDTIKAILCSLSIYYEMNIEAIFAEHDLLTWIHVLKMIGADFNLISYLESLAKQATNQQVEVHEPFSEVINQLKLPSKREQNELQRILKI